ncbi:type II toxin-antitoxin system RelE/ParE family toxin [Anabaena sp. CA = ATCC 33047]|uniref:type II toxin-antitoxin system RelE/ParE family toxin n=1 Tax=Anabaena sp. (strain CA / ATCC 33047) TaxID=52271 RepID=UPI000A04255E|nr:type II toxin-antitoxin system RelE/ParE family toxin [Anabaena sp. CA = ATCC 33047]
MKYVFHPEALTEYAEAVQYYAQQRAEVAQAFINAVENAVYQIRESPNRWTLVDEDVRRCLTRKFPYAILYTIEQDNILIFTSLQQTYTDLKRPRLTYDIFLLRFWWLWLISAAYLYQFAMRKITEHGKH